MVNVPWNEMLKQNKTKSPQLYRRWLQQKDTDFQAKLVCMQSSGLYESDTDGRIWMSLAN